MASVISIHAPSRGATRPYQLEFCYAADFYPRTLKGCDSVTSIFAKAGFDFYPRTLKGCDLPGQALRDFIG